MSAVGHPPRFYTVENHEAVYQDVRETWQHPVQAAACHWIFGKLLKPDTQFAPGVEDRLGQTLANGGQVAMAFTHGSYYDPVHIAAMAFRNKVFEPMRGKTMIGAKASLFKLPVLGRIIPELGAIPIWREGDVLGKAKTPEEKAARDAKYDPTELKRLKALQKASGKNFIDTEIIGMNQFGKHMAKLVTGTRNTVDKVPVVYDGFGKVMNGVDENKEVLMMTGAFYFFQGKRKPIIYLDILADQRRDDPKRITKLLLPALQDNLDKAITLSKN